MHHLPQEQDHEETLDAALPIIDSHHHLLVHTGERYLLEEYAADVASGHNIIASVYIECSAMYRQTGPQALRCVGEVEFAAGMAAMSESGLYGPTRVCAAIVGAADFTLGAAVDEVLVAHQAASGGRLRGIRGAANWDADPSVNTGTRPFAPQGLLASAKFREGFAKLAEHQLSFDAWQYHPQMAEVAALAQAFPDTTLIVDHCGGLLGIGPYARSDNFTFWKAMMTEVARCPNVVIKLGGLGPPRCGFGFEKRSTPASSVELADTWRPYIETCIELFGPGRAMFESNFPPDKVSGSYRRFWNAFKIITAGYSPAEKDALYRGTAARVYRIERRI